LEKIIKITTEKNIKNENEGSSHLSIDIDGEIHVKLSKVEETVKLQLNMIDTLNKEIEDIKTTQYKKRLSSVQKEGYLLREEEFIVRSWKRRFFFLQTEHLYYSKTKGDRFNTLGAIPLTGASVCEVVIPGKDYSFALKTTLKTYYMVASNQNEKIEWINALIICIQNLVNKDTEPKMIT